MESRIRANSTCRTSARSEISRACVVAGLLLGSTLWAGCGDRDESAASPDPVAAGPVQIIAIHPPLAFLARRLASEDWGVACPVPVGVDPAHWELDDEELRALQEADLVLRQGADYANWLDFVSLADERVIDTTARLRELLIEREDAVVHRHGPEGETHAHRGWLATTWLDPQLLAQQAERVAEAFADRWPDEAPAVQQRLEDLKAELLKWETSWQAVADPLRSQPLLAPTPHYEYFARRVGWDVTSLGWEWPEQAATPQPTDDDWRELDQRLSTDPAQWMLWPSPPAKEIEAELAKRDLRVIVFRLGDRSSASESDFGEVMRSNLESIRAAAAEAAER